jgi:glutathione S-transferase
MRLYDNVKSCNGYKVRLLLRQLAIAYEYVEIDIFARESRTPEFLAKNPNGRIPLLEHAPGQYLAESNAILYYLSEGTPFLAESRLDRAYVLQWLFFEQYSHEPYIAVTRSLLKYYADRPDPRHAQLPRLTELGYAALEVMEGHLRGRAFFVGERYGIADIALYAYTHVADEGGYDLARFPSVLGWLERVRSQPGHVPLTAR